MLSEMDHARRFLECIVASMASSSYEVDAALSVLDEDNDDGGGGGGAIVVLNFRNEFSGFDNRP